MTDSQPIGLPRIETESVSEKAESAIREHILSGQIPSGARLVESQLAQELGVSRAPVRAALKTLEGEGLVVTSPNRGAFVAEVTEEDLREIYLVRGVLEALSMRLAVSRLTPAAMEDLHSIVERMKQAARSGDAQAMAAVDLEFHQYIWELSGHKRLRQMLLSMMAPIRMFVALNARLYDNFLDNCLEHSHMLDAVQAGDAEQAGWLMGEHITEAGRLTVDYLAKRKQSS